MKKHNCPCCICGMIKLTWSDREIYVDPSNKEQLMDAILTCALDHVYDSIGVPDGLEDANVSISGNEFKILIYKVVDAYICSIFPKWKEYTVELTEAQEKELKDKIMDVLNKFVFT